MRKLRLSLVLMLPLILAGCGYGHGHASVSYGGGGCPSYIDPAIVVYFEDRITGRPIKVDASGVLYASDGRSKLLDVYERANPDPFVFSLFADVNDSDTYRLELFAARTLGEPLTEIVYEDIDVYFDACGPITQYIDVRLD